MDVGVEPRRILEDSGFELDNVMLRPAFSKTNLVWSLKSVKRLNCYKRRIHTTIIGREDATGSVGSFKERVKAENEDILTMDTFMKLVQDKSDPALHNIMPLRMPVLWAEALALASETKKHAKENVKVSQIDLTPRRMQDSYSELVLPFASSKDLVEQYTNAAGGIRTGKIMEHLDSLAGSIAYKHLLGPVSSVGKLEERGFYVVTASVDRLDMLRPLTASRDVRLSGHVIFTGRSSMEIGLRMESIGGGNPDETILIGRFSMVCRDNSTQKARQVNPLTADAPEETALFQLGENMKQRRQAQANTSLSKVPPDSEEAATLHSFYLQHGEGHPTQPSRLKDHVFMGDTIQERCMLMFPQERNVHGKIFGGYLMRLAYELGFTNASMFTRGPIRFLSSDGISFKHPVPIGSILRLRSQILHTSSSAEYPILVHVGVRANVVDVRTGEEQTTNQFRFTWCQEWGHESPDLRTVVPKTYKEAMLWLEGKRALELGAEIRGSRTD